VSLLPRRFVSRVDAWARRVVDDSSEKVGTQVTAAVERTVREELQELSRMIGQQGDAADELAETFGRTLTRLSEAVDELQSRLDRLEAGQGQHAGAE
jgi:ubiquinone biosynthesis protein UbiJ